MADPNCAPIRTPFVGSGRRPEGGFLAVHKRDFNAHISGGGFRHCASQIDVEDGISIPGDTVQEVLENISVGASDWFSVLTAGNFSGGIDVNVNNGSKIVNTTVGQGLTFLLSNNVNGNCGSFSFNGGNGTTAGSGFFVNCGRGDISNGGNIGLNAGSSAGGSGGDITIYGGEGLRSGGDISIAAGRSTDTEATNTSGGDFTISAGNSANGRGGHLYLYSGNGPTTNGNISITSNGNMYLTSSTGTLSLNNGEPLNWPTADGVAGQVIVTDGSGVLSFATISGGGGGETLAQTLAIGNNTGNITITSSGSNPVIQKTSNNSLDIIGHSLYDINIKNSDIISASNAGNIYLKSASNFSSGHAGKITIQAGSGSSLNPPTPGSQGGNVEILAGNGGQVSGDVLITAGSGDVASGNVKIRSGSGFSAGDIQLLAGSGSTTGNILIQSGDGANPGYIKLSTGSHTTNKTTMTFYNNYIGMHMLNNLSLTLGYNYYGMTVYNGQLYVASTSRRSMTIDYASLGALT